MSDTLVASQADIRLIGACFEIVAVNPGKRVDYIDASASFLDIYLGGAPADYKSRNGAATITPCPPNSFCFFPAGHARRLERTRSGAALQVTFRVDSTDEFGALCLGLTAHKTRWHMFDHALIGLASMIHDHLRTTDGKVSQSTADAFFRTLILRLHHVVRVGPTLEAPQRPDAVQRAIEYIEEHLGEPIQLKDVARAARFSPSHFARVFRQTMAMGVCEYVSLRRIEQAQHLIQHSNDSLADIAYTVGFGSQSHMTTVFRKMTGQTPGAFRRNMSPKSQVELAKNIDA